MADVEHPEHYFTHPQAIESVSDIIDIISRPNEYLSEIIEVDESNPHYPAPMGRTHQNAPRPFPHGLWFRGQSNAKWKTVPSVFRTETDNGTPLFYDEREMFTDVRLRTSSSDLRGFNNLEMMELMQHHLLPTRLMDWSESPLVAAFFAVFRQGHHHGRYKESGPPKRKRKETVEFDIDHDRSLYVINAFRLNEASNLIGHPDYHIFNPQEFDVVIRGLMAEHTYLNSVLSKTANSAHLAMDRVATELFDVVETIEGHLNSGNPLTDERALNFMARLSMPIALMPKRSHPRMDAQLSCFTLHGGKVLYGDVMGMDRRPRNDWSFIERPIHLHELNAGKVRFKLGGKSVNITSPRFMKKFRISKYAVPRIGIELNRMGITEAMIYPDMENQNSLLKNIWSTVGFDRPIWSLPRLESSIRPNASDPSQRFRDSADEHDFMKRLYGMSEK